MRLHLCGVRGSTPAPGPRFIRYGGHTSCVAVSSNGDAPGLIVDAGTGIRRATELLHGEPFRGTILFGHLHWDHTQGLPFFRAGDRDDSRVRLVLPAQGDPETVLDRAMGPPHFPVTVHELRGDWSIEGIEPGRYELEGYEVVAVEIPHKGGRTFGYRISDGTKTFTYMSDHMPLAAGDGPQGWGEYHEAAIELARDTDLLIHDSQYTGEEMPQRGYYGHSAVEYAVELARRASARKVLLFHHDPDRTDDEIDAIVAGVDAHGVEIQAAVEGAEIDLS